MIRDICFHVKDIDRLGGWNFGKLFVLYVSCQRVHKIKFQVTSFFVGLPWRRSKWETWLFPRAVKEEEIERMRKRFEWRSKELSVVSFRNRRKICSCPKLTYFLSFVFSSSSVFRFWSYNFSSFLDKLSSIYIICLHFVIIDSRFNDWASAFLSLLERFHSEKEVIIN